MATPQGKLARYFYGIEYAPRDLRLGLIEAAENKIGSPVDQLLLYCYHYDPATGKYGARGNEHDASGRRCVTLVGDGWRCFWCCAARNVQSCELDLQSWR